MINPEALRRTIEAGMLYGMSRALHEEVRFDTEKVTSVDWVSSPTLTHADTPESLEVVLVNGDPNPKRPDLPHYGAGETMSSRRWRRSGMRSSTQPVCACGACRSGMRACWRRSRRRGSSLRYSRQSDFRSSPHLNSTGTLPDVHSRVFFHTRVWL